MRLCWYLARSRASRSFVVLLLNIGPTKTVSVGFCPLMRSASRLDHQSVERGRAACVLGRRLQRHKDSLLGAPDLARRIERSERQLAAAADGVELLLALDQLEVPLEVVEAASVGDQHRTLEADLAGATERAVVGARSVELLEALADRRDHLGHQERLVVTARLLRQLDAVLQGVHDLGQATHSEAEVALGEDLGLLEQGPVEAAVCGRTVTAEPHLLPIHQSDDASHAFFSSLAAAFFESCSPAAYDDQAIPIIAVNASLE